MKGNQAKLNSRPTEISLRKKEEEEGKSGSACLEVK